MVTNLAIEHGGSTLRKSHGALGHLLKGLLVLLKPKTYLDGSNKDGQRTNMNQEIPSSYLTYLSNMAYLVWWLMMNGTVEMIMFSFFMR